MISDFVFGLGNASVIGLCNQFIFEISLVERAAFKEKTVQSIVILEFSLVGSAEGVKSISSLGYVSLGSLAKLLLNLLWFFTCQYHKTV